MRLFVAIRPGVAAAAALYHVGQRLREQAVKGNFTRLENLHLTLAFLGETARLEEAGAAVTAVRAEPFDLTLRGLGRFQKPGGDIWWVGAEVSEGLTALYHRLAEELRDRGFALEERPYRPHLTLCRRARMASGFDREAFDATLPPVTVKVDSISLMESARVNSVLTYTPLLHNQLQGDAR